jgi:FkbM family methyltransferase
MADSDPSFPVRFAELQAKFVSPTSAVTPQDCYEAAGYCAKNRQPLGALHLLDLGFLRFPQVDALRDNLFSLVENLHEAGEFEGLLDQLDAENDTLRAHHAKTRPPLERAHGPEGPRPATADFFNCVLYKNLGQGILGRRPLPFIFLRLSDFYGRRAAASVFGGSATPIRVSQAIGEITLGGKTVKFRATSPQITFELLYFYTAEPGMLRWIAGFDAADVVVDIGANVGKYSIIPAVTRGCSVYAIEPFTPNVEELKRHVALNGVGGKVTVMQAAISDETGERDLFFDKEAAGAASQSFDQQLSGPDEKTQNVTRIQGYRLDDLVADGTIPCPQHIKIDVDGTEHRVIDGMSDTLADRRLKSIRLEIRLADPKNAAALERIAAAGFDCAVDDDEKNWLCRRR